MRQISHAKYFKQKTIRYYEIKWQNQTVYEKTSNEFFSVF